MASRLDAQDREARERALDVTRSWLVQAPAGSGKTGLLIQRFLALLARVDRPERIVAMTFTRKSAAEMRDRILGALTEAAGASDVPDSQHARTTRELAIAALARDRSLGWNLLEQPSRLRISTIDALAAALARQAPVAADLGAMPGITERAQPLYDEAARAALARASPDDRHWQAFLRGLDNDATAATRLIARMLAGRERWPSSLFTDDPRALRQAVEHVLELEAVRAAATVRSRMPVELASSLPPLAGIAAAHFALSSDPPPFAAAVASLANHGALPDSEANQTWSGIARWLLTQDGHFLQRVTTAQGFPAKGSGVDAAKRAGGKAAFAQWLADAAAVPGLAEAMHGLRQVPPTRFADASWDFVEAAMRVLGGAVSDLQRIFAARGKVDFAEATLRALQALGSADDPGDLLLAIDYRLAHLLVDEFQDTSAAQLALIARLTAGWEAGDGRTLFAVGDPMQSIYRFRQAELGIFIDAQVRRCIGDVPVGVLDLARNFRSQPGLIVWVNQVFQAVLPPVSDAARGEAAYRPSQAADSGGSSVMPTIDLVRSRADEADAVVTRIRAARAAGAASIAVLVRARKHAQALLPALFRANIAYSAVELEGLHDRLATRDLLTLARALGQPADRLAWLALLRAPWCGLTLADLLAVAEASRSGAVIDAIGDPECNAKISAEGRLALSRLREALAPVLAARGRAPFALRLRSAWIALGGPACARTSLDRDGADRVLALAGAHELGGEIADYDAFAAEAAGLFAQADETAADAVQVMTLHRAKGLEFDAVVLPGLDRATNRGAAPLLRWKARLHDGVPAMILAPLRLRVGERSEDDPVYAWLAELDTKEEAAELARLLYVGTTRARRWLHLVAVAQTVASPDRKLNHHHDHDHQAAEEGQGVRTPVWQRPRRGSALERLWDGVTALLPAPPGIATGRVDAGLRTPNAANVLWRLPADWRAPALPPPLPVGSPRVRSDSVPFDWANATAAAIGTVAHRLLAQIGAEGLDAWDERRLQAERRRIVAELGAEGVERDQLARAAQRVAAVVARTLADARGRWLFDPAHGDAHGEWALSGIDDGAIVHIVIDRSFVADGSRYIVDFKTGEHQGGDPGAFLHREFERYAPQLARYARIVAAVDRRPLVLALYHPLVPAGWQAHAAGNVAGVDPEGELGLR
jgi:ATP-dependent exoDNAse (exonuclease V) beta subunit